MNTTFYKDEEPQKSPSFPAAGRFDDGNKRNTYDQAILWFFSEYEYVVLHSESYQLKAGTLFKEVDSQVAYSSRHVHPVRGKLIINFP